MALKPYNQRCNYCRHWRMLRPDDEYYSPESPGVVGKCGHPTPDPNLGTLKIAFASSFCDQFEAEEPPIIRPICANCAFWKNFGMTTMGHCNNPEFVPEQDPNHWWIDTPYEGINYGKYEGYSAGMRTGEAFGCIHHQPKETT